MSLAAIFQAAESGDVTRLQEILSNDTSLANAENEHGLTLLGYAAHFGQSEAVALILDQGAEINALSHSKLSFIPSNTALHAAIAGKHLDVVALLITRGADVNAVDSHGLTPLLLAAFEGRQDIAELLLKNGADAQVKNADGETAFTLASKKGHQEFAELVRI